MSETLRDVLVLCLLAAAPGAHADNVYRDPMRPYAPPAAAESASEPVHYRLSSVLVSPHRRVAVINGRICRVGDRVSGAEVLAIERAWVRLRVGGKELIVALNGQVPREDMDKEEAAP